MKSKSFKVYEAKTDRIEKKKKDKFKTIFGDVIISLSVTEKQVDKTQYGYISPEKQIDQLYLIDIYIEYSTQKENNTLSFQVYLKYSITLIIFRTIKETSTN